MRYKGAIGEFNPAVFVVCVVVSVGIAFGIYRQLDFVREQPAKEASVVTQLSTQISSLEGKLEALQQRVKAAETEIVNLKQQKCR
jgi:cell division protein FtsB